MTFCRRTSWTLMFPPVSGLRGRLGSRSRLALLATGFVLLLTAWVMSTQPFDAPDEALHYLRALGIANGQLLGRKAPYVNPALSPEQNRFLSYDTTLVMVPRNMRPGNVPCFGGSPDAASCFAVTPNGNFPPLPYLLPALALKASPDVSTGLWLTRAASALPSLLLILLALAILWDGTAISVLGLLAAITPMVLFSSSIMNSSGPGITGALALGAAALRIARERALTPAWVSHGARGGRIRRDSLRADRARVRGRLPAARRRAAWTRRHSRAVARAPTSGHFDRLHPGRGSHPGAGVAPLRRDCPRTVRHLAVLPEPSARRRPTSRRVPRFARHVRFVDGAAATACVLDRVDLRVRLDRRGAVPRSRARSRFCSSA